LRQTGDSFKAGKNQRTVKLIHLYAIHYDTVSNQYLRYTDYGKEINFLGYTYTPYTIRHGDIDETLTGKVSTTQLILANVNRNIEGINDNFSLLEKEVKIYTVTEELLSDLTSYISDTFRIKDVGFSKHEARLALRTSFDVQDLRLPRRYYFRAYCRFRFKDGDCKYSGVEGDCDKTLQRCRQLENTPNFGAFPSIPLQKLLFK